MTSRFVVGIDLGTTNSALACVDTTHGDDARVRVLNIPQLVNPGEVAPQPLLPSFLYAPGPLDFAAGSTALPWEPGPTHVVGELARQRGAENPSRLVASAKSWLSHAGVDRTAAILPWGSSEDVQRISPVDASAAYLRHLAAAFDASVADGRVEHSLAHQEVLLTVPASFDEEARELTLRAAQGAGLEHVTLLEEPQAAFYAWLDAHGRAVAPARRRRRPRTGVRRRRRHDRLQPHCRRRTRRRLTLERIAVGDHILLGGDNMDLALARLLQRRLEAAGHRVDTWQLHGLWHQARVAKEALLTTLPNASGRSRSSAAARN